MSNNRTKPDGSVGPTARTKSDGNISKLVVSSHEKDRNKGRVPGTGHSLYVCFWTVLKHPLKISPENMLYGGIVLHQLFVYNRLLLLRVRPG